MLSARLRAPALAARPWLLSLAGAGIATIAVHFWRPDPWRSPARLTIGIAIVVAAAILLALYLWKPTRTRLIGDLAVAFAATVAVLALALDLSGTPLLPMDADVSLRMSAAVRFAHTWVPGSANYRGLPAAYPPLLPYVTGRVAWIVGVSGWAALKYASFTALALMPVVGYTLWRRLTSVLPAAFIGSTSVLLFVAYRPEEWLSAVVFVPWLLLVLETRNAGWRSRRVLALGVIGGLMIPLYYFYLLPGVFIVPLVFIATRVFGPRLQIRPALRIAAITLVVSAWYWLPLLVSLLTSHHVSNGQVNYYKVPGAGQKVVPTFGFSALGVLNWIGILFIVVRFLRDRLARYLAAVVVGGAAWIVLGKITTATIHNTLIYWRAANLIDLALLAGAVLAMARVVETAPSWLADARFRRALPAGFAALGALALVARADALRADRLVHLAHSYALPNGTWPKFNPHRTPQPTVVPTSFAKPGRPLIKAMELANRNPLPSNRELFHAIGGYAASSDVIVSQRATLNFFYPVYYFNATSPSYADAAAGYAQRQQFLVRLSTVMDPAQFATLSAHNPFNRIHAFILYRAGGGLLAYNGRVDDFGHGTKPLLITFHESQFASPEWRVTNIGPFFIAVRQVASAT